MGVIVTLVALAAAFTAFRIIAARQAHTKLLSTPLDAHDRTIVEEMVPLTKSLPADLRSSYEGKISAFLDQIEFIGCDGLEITHDIELSIAAQACLLIVNRNIWYKHLSTILVYPGAFKSVQRSFDGLVVSEEEITRLGESWQYGPVVLSWAHSDHGAQDTNDGKNLVFHEFAHQLDALTGDTNGIPPLADGQTFAEWEQVFVAGYEAHVRDTKAGRRTLIDPYGATNYQEFLAVSIELFFEKPTALANEEPAIYDQLAKLLNLDPRMWPF